MQATEWLTCSLSPTNTKSKFEAPAPKWPKPDSDDDSDTSGDKNTYRHFSKCLKAERVAVVVMEEIEAKYSVENSPQPHS
jgi:hypothetical protein